MATIWGLAPMFPCQRTVPNFTHASGNAYSVCCAPAKRCSAVPSGPRGETRLPQKLNYKITTVQCLNVQRGSLTHYSPVVTPRTLPSVGRSTKWDTHHSSVSRTGRQIRSRRIVLNLVYVKNNKQLVHTAEFCPRRQDTQNNQKPCHRLTNIRPDPQ